MRRWGAIATLGLLLAGCGQAEPLRALEVVDAFREATGETLFIEEQSGWDLLSPIPYGAEDVVEKDIELVDRFGLFHLYVIHGDEETVERTIATLRDDPADGGVHVRVYEPNLYLTWLSGEEDGPTDARFARVDGFLKSLTED